MVTLMLCKLSLLSRSKGEQDKWNIGRTRVTSRQSFKKKNTLQNIGLWKSLHLLGLSHSSKHTTKKIGSNG